MNRKVGWLLTGVLVGMVAVGLQARSKRNGKAMIPVNERVLAVARIDMGTHGVSPGDQEIIRSRVPERGTATRSADRASSARSSTAAAPGAAAARTSSRRRDLVVGGSPSTGRSTSWP